MIAVEIAQFMLLYAIASVIWRLLAAKLADTTLGPTFAFIAG